ncbi:MAG: hypothetical protein ABIZ56_01445 [Chthoniobacteraceae bacterium]
MIARRDHIQSETTALHEGDHIAQLRFERIAMKIEANPELLEIPLANIARWLAQGHSARKRLEGWRGMIAAARQSGDGMKTLLALLRADSSEAIEWKGFSPFAGILTPEELDGLRWTSRH